MTEELIREIRIDEVDPFLNERPYGIMFKLPIPLAFTIVVEPVN